MKNCQFYLKSFNYDIKHLISDGIWGDIKATIDCTVFNKCFDEILCIHLIQMK